MSDTKFYIRKYKNEPMEISYYNWEIVFKNLAMVNANFTVLRNIDESIIILEVY